MGWRVSDHLLQIAQTAREHFRRRQKSGGFRFAQKIHHVSGHETDAIARFGDPVTETALIILTARENSERVLELFINLRAAETEIGFTGQHQAAERATRDLFAATVRKIFQVLIEAARESERQRRDS